jgi:hypothetical protein
MTPDDTLAPRAAALGRPASAEISLHFFSGPRASLVKGYATLPFHTDGQSGTHYRGHPGARTAFPRLNYKERMNNTSIAGLQSMIVVSPQTPRERERRSGPSVDASRDFGNPTTVASAKPTALPGACRALIGTVRTMKARTMKRRATHRLHFLWLSAGLFAGCVSVGPNYHRPPVETPPAFKEAEGWKIAAPRDAEPRGNWWDIYKDPDLDALMRQVQISNQNVLLAVARYEQAVGLLGSARAGYYPTVTADVSTTRSQSTATTTPSSVVTSKSRTVTLDRASLGVSWDIDVWGRIRRTVESNSDAAQASAGDLASALLSAQATLAQSYFQLRVIDLDIGLLERSRVQASPAQC